MRHCHFYHLFSQVISLSIWLHRPLNFFFFFFTIPWSVIIILRTNHSYKKAYAEDAERLPKGNVVSLCCGVYSGNKKTKNNPRRCFLNTWVSPDDNNFYMLLQTPFTLVSVTFIWFQSHTVMSRQKCRKGDSHERENWHCPLPPTPNPPSATLFCLTTKARTRGPCARAHTHTLAHVFVHSLSQSLSHARTHAHTRTHQNNTHTQTFPHPAVTQDPPYVMAKSDGSGGYEGFVVDLLDKMAEKASFNYKLKVINGTYGHQEPDSTWSGLIGRVVTIVSCKQNEL